MECKKCGYSWIPRVKNPKECPRCKTRLDYIPKAIRAIMEEKVEVVQ